jgi:CDP-diglyceride synthetase
MAEKWALPDRWTQVALGLWIAVCLAEVILRRLLQARPTGLLFALWWASLVLAVGVLVVLARRRFENRQAASKTERAVQANWLAFIGLMFAQALTHTFPGDRSEYPISEIIYLVFMALWLSTLVWLLIAWWREMSERDRREVQEWKRRHWAGPGSSGDGELPDEGP